MSKFSAFDSVSGFIKTIPRTVVENLEFRINLHKMLAKDKQAQAVFWAMCKQRKQILFDTTFFTLNPQKTWGEQNQPFILRPKQIPAVEKLDWCITNGHDAAINKTRKQGASEIVAKLFAAWCMLYERVHFIIGSDKKEDVDNIGNDYTLMAKVDNVFECLPSWMDFKYERGGGCVQRKDMLLRVKKNNSAIVGETTNENFSAGSRATAMALDEFGRVRKSIADSIEGSIHDVVNCVIYSSTHWLGQNHTFNNCLNKETTKKIDLMWFDNPCEQNEGLYRSPEVGVIELLDVDYYKRKFPRIFNYVEN